MGSWARAVQVALRVEFDEVERALVTAWELMQADKFEWRVEDEDIHMNLERFVTDKIGMLGKKMRIRVVPETISIATTLRLFVLDSVEEIANGVKELGKALVNRAEHTQDILVPGLTHVQNGQPIRFGHVLAGHAWAPHPRPRKTGKRRKKQLWLPCATRFGRAFRYSTRDRFGSNRERRLDFARRP